MRCIWTSFAPAEYVRIYVQNSGGIRNCLTRCTLATYTFSHLLLFWTLDWFHNILYQLKSLYSGVKKPLILHEKARSSCRSYTRICFTLLRCINKAESWPKMGDSGVSSCSDYWNNVVQVKHAMDHLSRFCLRSRSHDHCCIGRERQWKTGMARKLAVQRQISNPQTFRARQK